MENSSVINIIIPIVIGLVSIVLSIFSKNKFKKMQETGVETEGVIFDLIKDSKGSSSDFYTNSATTTYPVIRFITKDKVWITKQPSIKIGLSFGFKKGDKVKVFYKSENPEDFIFLFRYQNLVLNGVLIFGIGLLVLGLFNAYKYLTT